MKWKDDTSYQRGERGTVEPRAWTLELGGAWTGERRLSITVHRMHGMPDLWFLSTTPALYYQTQLAATDAKSARREGLALVRYYLVITLEMAREAPAEPAE